MINVASYGPLKVHYMNRIRETLNKSLREHCRTMVLRVDLRLPDFTPYESDSTLITRFMESLKSQKNADQIKKISNNKRCHPCRIRYIWAREFNENGKKHYTWPYSLTKTPSLTLEGINPTKKEYITITWH